MARLHRNFRNIHRGARKAGETLFVSKPWIGTDEEKQTKYERFLRDASAVYGLPTPTLAVIPEGDVYGYVAPNTIVIDKYSVTSLFNAFRCHMQYMGATDVGFYNGRDAQAWACSLFYTLRPIQFRKMVREGRIRGVTPDDLLTSATLAARQDEVDEAFAGLIDASFTESEVDDLEDESADGLDDDEEADEDEQDEDGEVSVDTAAQLLNVSTSTVRNMLRDGRLTEVRIGRRVFVKRSSILAVQRGT